MADPLGFRIAAGVAKYGPWWKHPDQASRIRRSAPIHAYVGSNGSGKSWLIARDTLPTLQGIPWFCDQADHLHTMEGRTSGLRRVISTMGFRDPILGGPHPLWVPLAGWGQITDAEHADLVLDEVAGVASSRETSGLPAAVATTLQELRRRDVMVRWSAPAFPRADRILRETSTMVTLAMGHMRVPEDTRVVFAAAHEGCDQEGEHFHDSGREWHRTRLVRARSYDAQTFDEFTLHKTTELKPVVSTLDWIPDSAASHHYDTYAEVLKLAQVTDSGRCLDCSGTRTRQKCTCDQASMKRIKARWTSHAAAGDAETAPAGRRAQRSEHDAPAASGAPAGPWGPPAA